MHLAQKRRTWCALVHGTLGVAALTLGALPSYAWSGPGHMAIALVAYREMKPQTRAAVDALLKAHPDYSEWVKEVPTSATPELRQAYLFAIAATWPDRIKGNRDPSVTIKFLDAEGRNPLPSPLPTDPHYPDLLMHKNWHYADLPISTDGVVRVTETPNAIVEIPVCRDGVANTANPASYRAYYLAWLEHLVGDIHQPLHATSRYSAAYPKGDAGGNGVRLEHDLPGESGNLHAYWDGLLTHRSADSAGGYGGPPDWAGIESTASELVTNAPKNLAGFSSAVRDDLNPVDWAAESLQIDQDFVYTFGVDASGPVAPPDAVYHTTAVRIADQRGSLAAHRLALMLDAALAPH